MKRIDVKEQQDRIFLLKWVMQYLLSPIVSALNLFDPILHRRIQDRELLIGSFEVLAGSA